MRGNKYNNISDLICAIDLIFRYLMQKLPLLNIQPFLTLPINKNSIVHYVLVKSSFSFFNLMGLFFYIPFSIILIKEGYDPKGVLGWLFLMIFIILLDSS